MTYCVAITVDEGLVFASDSRTNAGVDQVSTYSKMHTFSGEDRQIVILSAGNLATTQAVMAQIARDVNQGAPLHIHSVHSMAEVAEYVGNVSQAQGSKHGEAVARAGFSVEATFIVGGQIASLPPQLFLVYPQGNYITTSEKTRFLQIGETKYGKVILDRIIQQSTPLEEAARCALVSMDSTMRSNVTVGPPIELLSYRADSIKLEHYLCLGEDDPYLIELKRYWNEHLLEVFRQMPRFQWGQMPLKSVYR
jgi:putative proteasome-type protease